MGTRVSMLSISMQKHRRKKAYQPTAWFETACNNGKTDTVVFPITLTKNKLLYTYNPVIQWMSFSRCYPRLNMQEPSMLPILITETKHQSRIKQMCQSATHDMEGESKLCTRFTSLFSKFNKSFTWFTNLCAELIHLVPQFVNDGLHDHLFFCNAMFRANG